MKKQLRKLWRKIVPLSIRQLVWSIPVVIHKARMLTIRPYYSCLYISENSFFITGRIDNAGNPIAFCCEAGRPAHALDGTPQEILERHKKIRDEIIRKSKKAGKNKSDSIAGCSTCNIYTLDRWKQSKTINQINLSLYPSPCQCKCFYCSVHDSDMSRFNKDALAKPYEKVFALVDYTLSNRATTHNILWAVACGEISIHPYKDRILKYICDNPFSLLTNCFIFDEKIADLLSSNENGFLGVSLDAGTPQTWLKVKGVDNFDCVVNNLIKYSKSCCRPNRINLKYIVFPGLNDTADDYSGIIKIAKELQLTRLTVSRDFRYKYTDDWKMNDDLLSSVAKLRNELMRNGITAIMRNDGDFSKEEIARIKEISDSIFDETKITP